jgi:hypothetical protein
MNAIILIFVFWFSAASDLFGRIRNGYEQHLHTTRETLRALRTKLAAGDLSFRDRMKAETEIEKLTTYLACYELTEELIGRMKSVSPGIFSDINAIKDKKGRPVDVYVKLVSKEKARLNLKAVTFIGPVLGDEDAGCSEYGPLSVSVEICIGDNALFLLSHEFGHIEYIVPNFASYKKFYQKRYGGARHFNLSYIGHGHHDQSGRSARLFEKLFLKDKAIYEQDHDVKPDGFVRLYSHLKKTHKKSDVTDATTVVHVF